MNWKCTICRLVLTLRTGDTLGQALRVTVGSVWTLDGVDTAKPSWAVVTQRADSSIAQLPVVVTRVVERHRVVESVRILTVDSRHTPVTRRTITYNC